jgi:hypothetical protein
MIYCRVLDGVVVDRSLWDEPMPADKEDYNEWVQDDVAQIGWFYDGKTFTPPPVVNTLPADKTPTIEERLAALEATVKSH